MIEPPKRILIEEEICTRIDGCRIVGNICVDCLTCEELSGGYSQEMMSCFIGSVGNQMDND